MFGCFINKVKERVFGILALRFEILVSNNKFFYSFSFIDFFSFPSYFISLFFHCIRIRVYPIGRINETN